MTLQAPSSSSASSDGIRIEREPRAIVVKRHDAVIAASERALLVHGILEAPVYYVPREDVYMEHLVEADDGAERAQANGRRFLSVTASGGGVVHAAWTHGNTTGDHAGLAGHVGFDPAIFNVTAGA